jgi:hypothetical protein
MKAVFKKTALDKLHEILEDAERRRKKIDYLLLTPEEWDEVRPYVSYPWDVRTPCDPVSASFRIVELTPKGKDWRRPYRFPVQPYKLLGHDIDIVVAPAEYH